MALSNRKAARRGMKGRTKDKRPRLRAKLDWGRALVDAKASAGPNNTGRWPARVNLARCFLRQDTVIKDLERRLKAARHDLRVLRAARSRLRDDASLGVARAAEIAQLRAQVARLQQALADAPEALARRWREAQARRQRLGLAASLAHPDDPG